METKYLDSTPVGNILTGFDNYTKGVTAISAQRRKVGAMEQNRVFSRSSISYNPSNVRHLGSHGQSEPIPVPHILTLECHPLLARWGRHTYLWRFDPGRSHACLDLVRQ